MKYLAHFAMFLGLVTTVGIVVHEGPDTILALLAHAGWPLLLLLPYHLIPILFDAIGWRPLILARVPLAILCVITGIREAINRLLPVANVGGEVAGVHFLMRQGVSGTAAAASVIIEVMLTLVAQALFVVSGLFCLSAVTGHLQGGHALSLAAAVMCFVPILSYWLLRSGYLFTAVHRMASKFFEAGGRFAAVLDNWGQLDRAIRQLTLDGKRLTAGLAWQFVGLMIGCAETWLVLRWLGHPTHLSAAVAIDSTTLALRSVAFVVPAGLGVQEAVMILIGGVLGIGSDVALTLSLVKRMREVVFGLFGLAAWQWMEHAVPRGGVRPAFEP